MEKETWSPESGSFPVHFLHTPHPHSTEVIRWKMLCSGNPGTISLGFLLEIKLRFFRVN